MKVEKNNSTFCFRESWWLLAPNTPRQDPPGPCTLRRNFKFWLTLFPAPAGQRANPWFALCTPCSFSAAHRGIAEKDEGVQGENLRLTPWSTGVETIMGAKIKFFATGAGPMVLPRGVGGEKPPTKKTRKENKTN